MRGGGQVGPEDLAALALVNPSSSMEWRGGGKYTTSTILHYENERSISGYYRQSALAVKRAQADAVFFKAVC